MSDWHSIVYRLGKVENLPGSDFLETTTVMGEFPVIVRKGDFKEGELVGWIPYDSIVPSTQDFYFLAPQPKKDKSGNVVPSPPVGEVPVKYRLIKSKKIRGFYSEGLIVKIPIHLNEGDSIVEHFGLTKRVYEEELPELPGNGGGENEKSPKTFSLFKYDLEGLAKYSSVFEEGEEVLITEKIEGENCTFVYLENKLWVRSRNYFKRNGKAIYLGNKTWLQKLKYKISNWINPPKNTVALSHWWEVPIRLNLEEKLKRYPGLAIWGELFGNVKHFHYDCEIVNGKIQREFRVFDIFDIKKKKFLEWSEVEKIANELGLKTVPVLYKGPWKTDRSLHELAEGKSTIGDCVREGFVMRSVPEQWHSKLGRKIIKLKGRDYKLFKG